MWKEIPPFSFSAGERKIMAHFVVKSVVSFIYAAQPHSDLTRVMKFGFQA